MSRVANARGRSAGIAAATLAVACLGATTAAGETGERPAETVPVRIELSSHAKQPARGHAFTFARTLDYCGPAGSVQEVDVKELPRTASRPWGAAVVTAIVAFPAYVPPSVCPPLPPLWETLHARTKRPARSLAFFDGSSDPPRRIWPLGSRAIGRNDDAGGGT